MGGENCQIPFEELRDAIVLVALRHGVGVEFGQRWGGANLKQRERSKAGVKRGAIKPGTVNAPVRRQADASHCGSSSCYFR